MKNYRQELTLHVPAHCAFVDITEHVAKYLDQSGIQEGLLLANPMHNTSSVFINDSESGLLADFDIWLDNLAPHEPTSRYLHKSTGEMNADSHLKRQVMGRGVVVAVTEGKLDFGLLERIIYGEFDGRRDKRVLIKIIGE
jgi:secondary thiamine-phosphate synthase enzyme